VKSLVIDLELLLTCRVFQDTALRLGFWVKSSLLFAISSTENFGLCCNVPTSLRASWCIGNLFKLVVVEGFI